MSQSYVEDLQEILYFLTTNYARSKLWLCFTLLIYQFVLAHLSIHTRCSTCCTNSAQPTDWGSQLTLCNCRKMAFSFNEAVRQQTFEHIYRGRLVISSIHICCAFHRTQSFYHSFRLFCDQKIQTPCICNTVSATLTKREQFERHTHSMHTSQFSRRFCYLSAANLYSISWIFRSLSVRFKILTDDSTGSISHALTNCWTFVFLQPFARTLVCTDVFPIHK